MSRKVHQNISFTLAILPFENLTVGRDLDIFCKSFSIELITEFSRFRQFQIIAYDSVQSYGHSPDVSSETFQKLNSDYYINGSFRHHDSRIRINIQLINSKTNHLVWADRFSGESEDLMEIQENLLMELVASLQGQLNYNLLSLIRKKPRTNLRAYEYWLYGMEEVKKGSLENDLKAREYFQHAIELDPDYSLAYSGMSLTYFNEWSCQLWNRWELSRNGAFEWAEKAIELDEQNYVAAYVLGRIFLYECAWETAEHYLRKSLRLNSNDPESLVQIAMCFMYLGYGNEAFKLFKKAVRLNPAGENSYYPMGAMILIEQGKYEDGLSLAGRIKQITYVDAPAYLAAACFYLKKYEKMNDYWQQFLDNYSRLINYGKPATTGEAIQWMINVNPFRQHSKSEVLWEYLGGDEFLLTPSSESLEKKQSAFSALDSFRKKDDFWELIFKGKECLLKEVKGFFDIRELITHPRQPVHCAELMDVKVSGSGEQIFDHKAKEAYKEKLLDLQKKIEQADFNNDFEKLSSLQEEYDVILDHLSTSLGLSGKVRESGNPIEKARSAVTWRIRSAISKIEKAHPHLGKHLSNSIQTGTFCSYEPETDMEWVV